MDVEIREFFDSVGSFFTGGDNIPWCDRNIIAGCEREVADSGSAESKNESLMGLSWALIHSRHPEDVNRGIAVLEASLASSASPLQKKEKLYLLAVGFYRNGDYSRSRQLLEHCLADSATLAWGPEASAIAPDWRQAQTQKKVVEDRITKGIGIAPDCRQAQTQKKVVEDRITKGTGIAPDCRQAQTQKKVVEDRITKGIGIAPDCRQAQTQKKVVEDTIPPHWTGIAVAAVGLSVYFLFGRKKWW